MKTPKHCLFILETLFQLKLFSNLLWKTQILETSEDFLCYIKALTSSDELSLEQQRELDLLSIFLEDKKNYMPSFSNSALALETIAQSEAQLKLSRILKKIDKISARAWNSPEKLTEIDAEKLAIYLKKFFDIGPQAYPELSNLRSKDDVRVKRLAID